MSIISFDCFSGRQIAAYPMRSVTVDSAFSTRTGFNGAAVQITQGNARLGNYIKADRSEVTEIYCSLQFENIGDRSYDIGIIGLYDNALPNPVFAILRQLGSPRELKAYRLDGSGTFVFLAQGTGYSVNNGTVYNIEFYWKCGQTDGAVKVWLNGTLVIDVSGVDTTNGTSTGATMWMVGAATSSGFVYGNGYFGEIICADARIHDPFTQRKTFAVLTPTGAGSNSQWTGAYSDVDETPPNDSDKIYVNSVDQVQTFALSNLPAGISSIDGVKVNARFFGQGGPTPRNVQPAIRTNSTNYFGDSKAVPANKPWYNSKIWLTNPYTTSPWTESGVDALEAGVKSVT